MSGKMRLREHDVTLKGERISLRPMTEGDWGILLKWNSDPEVLYYSEGDDVAAYSLDEVQAIYRETSQTAFCFIIEVRAEPIGECWLQGMNLDRVLKKYPGNDCRRVDMVIGEKHSWNRGYGTEAIRLLVEFAFLRENVDAVFGCGAADYNPRSLRMLQKAGFEVDAEFHEPKGSKAKVTRDFVLWKRNFQNFKGMEATS